MSITQVLAHALIAAGIPAPLAALTAVMALVLVPLAVGIAAVALLERLGRGQVRG